MRSKPDQFSFQNTESAIDSHIDNNDLQYLTENDQKEKDKTIIYQGILKDS